MARFHKPTEDPAWLKAIVLTCTIGFIVVGLILLLAQKGSP